MSTKKKTYVCTHDVTCGGKVIKAGKEIPANSMSKRTIEQYLAGGILSEYKASDEDIVIE